LFKIGGVVPHRTGCSKKEKTNEEELLHNRIFLVICSPKMINTIIIIMGELLNGGHGLFCGKNSVILEYFGVNFE
jgi:hypothetical protein